MICTKVVFRPMGCNLIWFLLLGFFLSPLAAMEELIDGSHKQKLFQKFGNNPGVTKNDLYTLIEIEKKSPARDCFKNIRKESPLKPSGYDFTLLPSGERFDRDYGTPITEDQILLKAVFEFYWYARNSSFASILGKRNTKNNAENKITEVTREIFDEIISERIARKRRIQRYYEEEYEKDLQAPSCNISDIQVKHWGQSDSKAFASCVLEKIFNSDSFSKGFMFRFSDIGTYTKEVITCRGIKGDGSPHDYLSYVIRIMSRDGETDIRHLLRLRYFPEVRALAYLHLHFPYEFPRLTQLARSEECGGILKCINDKRCTKFRASVSHAAQGIELEEFLNDSAISDETKWEALKEVGFTLANAHLKGVGHGDFSKRNIFVKRAKSGWVISWIDLGDVEETLNLLPKDRILNDLMRFYVYPIVKYIKMLNERPEVEQNITELSQQFICLLKGYTKRCPEAEKIICEDLWVFFKELANGSTQGNGSEDPLACHETLGEEHSAPRQNNYDGFWLQGYWKTKMMEAALVEIRSLAPFNAQGIKLVKKYLWNGKS